MNQNIKTISICICTYKRPQLLEKMICELEHLKTDDTFTYNIIFVDNDPQKSAEKTVAELKANSKLQIDYFHEPERSISHARNRTIKEAKGDFIAFIDDDEFPSDVWLQQLFNSINYHSADGVLGPVAPYYDNETPVWLRRSGLLDRDRLKTGDIIKSSKYTRTGNVLFKKQLFDNLQKPFDPKYGIIGGGDVEFFERMLSAGKKFVWCDDAVVYEHIEEKRRNKLYYIKRAFTRGLTNSMKYSFLSIGTLKSLIAVPLYGVVLPISAIFGQHNTIKYAVKLCDHLGRILGYLKVKVVKERPY